MAYFRQPPSSGAEATIVSKTITANGTYNASSDSADGYNPVTVNVPGPVLGPKSISANGTYMASADGYDGFSFVTVSVSGGAQATITVSYDSSFYNKTMTCSDGITTYTETTTNAGSTVFSVNASGTWTVSCNGVTRAVEVVLEYSTQMVITQTVTVYSAASDTVSFTDVTGAKTVTTNTSGQGSVSISFIPNSTITFTSSIAKNPTNLSQAYSKTITMTDSITTIKVMPDNTIYWWGNEVVAVTTQKDTNGGVVIKNTQDISIDARTQSTASISQIRTTATQSLSGFSKISAIFKASGTVTESAYNRFYVGYVSGTSEYITTNASTSGATTNLSKLTYDISESTSKYPCMGCKQNVGTAYFYALWLE